MTNVGRGRNHSCDGALGLHGFESIVKTLEIKRFGGRHSIQREWGWQMEGYVALRHGEDGHIQLLIDLIVLRSRGHVLEEVFSR